MSKETLDLLVHPADSLHLSVLVDRAGHGEVLAKRKLGERRQQRVKLGRGCAVSFDAAVGLLEDEARKQRHRRIQRVTARQKARQDQYALGVDGAAEGDLALDIDHLAAARPNPAGDSASAARNRNPPSSATLSPFTWPMRAPLVSMSATSSRMLSWARSRSREDRRSFARSRFQRRRGISYCTAGLAGPEISLGKHVVKLIDNERQLVGMIGQPGSVLDHQRGAGAIHRSETVPPRQRRNHARVRSFARRRPIGIIFEIGEHLEMLGNIGIEGRQQVVQQPIAE